MPVDPSYLGRTYPPTAPYEVGREKIREFAAAIGERNPVHHDTEAARALGHPDVIAPPTFAIVLTLPAGGQLVDDPGFGLDYSRVVHADQRFVHHRPIHAGDVLQVVLTVEAVRSVGGNDIVTSRADVLDAAGDPVVTAYATLAARGTAS